MDLTQRPRRNRRSEALRNMVAETRLGAANLVWPVFICEGRDLEEAIPTLPGCWRWSVDRLLHNLAHPYKLGVRALALFPAVPESKKDKLAREALNPNGLVPTAIRSVKDRYPDIMVITDVALDPYSADGHDGLVEKGEVVNDATVEVLAAMAVVQAKAGADMVAPSDMMDGRVRAIRRSLDESGFSDRGIISYAAKYASGFYGPFRDALGSQPKFGDKKTYQMDFRNSREALREVQLDIEEGADMVMIKPALAYLDVINEVRKAVHVPVAAYNVSGEYAMIKAAAQMGMVNETLLMVETLTAIKRAGADVIFTYFAPQMAQHLADKGAL